MLQLAKHARDEVQRLGLQAPEPLPQPTWEGLVPLYDRLITSRPLRSATRSLFMDGHYAEAVEEAYKCVNNTVKKKSGSSLDGADLMHHVFSEDNPILKLNELTTKSRRDEQMGYRFIFAGCMIGIRNPRAHEHDLRDDPNAALESLIWANHLLKVVDQSKRARPRRKLR